MAHIERDHTKERDEDYYEAKPIRFTELSSHLDHVLCAISYLARVCITAELFKVDRVRNDLIGG